MFYCLFIVVRVLSNDKYTLFCDILDVEPIKFLLEVVVCSLADVVASNYFCWLFRFVVGMSYLRS